MQYNAFYCSILPKRCSIIYRHGPPLASMYNLYFIYGYRPATLLMATQSIPLHDTDGLLERLGRQVRLLRARLAITRRALAARAQVSERYLADLESGRGNVSVRAAGAYCRCARDRDDRLAGIRREPHGRRKSAGGVGSRPPEEQQKQALQLLHDRFPVAPGHKRRVALVGLRGAGKSTLGQRLAERLDLPFVGLVGEVEGIAGMSVAEIFSLSGEDGYRRIEEQALHETLDRFERCVIETGGSIVAEPTLLNTLLTTCFVVWLRTRPEQYMARVVAPGRPSSHAQSPPTHGRSAAAAGRTASLLFKGPRGRGYDRPRR